MNCATCFAGGMSSSMSCLSQKRCVDFNTKNAGPKDRASRC